MRRAARPVHISATVVTGDRGIVRRDTDLRQDACAATGYLEAVP